jgi:hypothetical protein
VDDCFLDPRVLTARVLEASSGPQPAGVINNSLVTQPASFAPGPFRRKVFQPIDLQKQPIAFAAKLTEDFMGARLKKTRRS